MPSLDEIINIAKSAKTPEEAENTIIKHFGELPDQLLDPTIRTEVYKHVGGGAASTTIEAHLSNFQQAYEEKLPNARAIGYQRNVEEQGLPGTKQWVRQQKENMASKPAPEIPPTTKG